MINNTEAISNRIKKDLPGTKILEMVPMSRYTSFKAGGCADLMVMPEDEESLKSVLGILSEEGCPHMVLGNGSNVLVRDGGYRGVIVHLQDGFRHIRTDGEELVCGSAVMLSAVAKEAQAKGLAGFEFASGIPGSIGGAVFMNAGAYGGEIKNVLKSVRIVTSDGKEIRELGVDELDLGYRRSILQETGDVVTEVRLLLHEGDPLEIGKLMAELTSRRNAKQPVNLPSAGSFFKRPEGHFAGKLIEDAGLAGLSVGGAQVSELHCGFIVNKGNATATDILQLMGIIQATVMERSGVLLEPEVRIIGE